MGIVEQLVEIYKKEPWHKTRMSDKEAMEYHKTRYDNGDIYCYTENGKVLGYYERYFLFDSCFLYNVYIEQNHRKGKVFKELYRHFWETMPLGIKKIIGEKQKLGGKVIERKTKWGLQK